MTRCERAVERPRARAALGQRTRGSFVKPTWLISYLLRIIANLVSLRNQFHKKSAVSVTYQGANRRDFYSFTPIYLIASNLSWSTYIRSVDKTEASTYVLRCESVVWVLWSNGQSKWKCLMYKQHSNRTPLVWSFNIYSRIE